MKTDENKIILLYERLLDITVKEKKELEGRNPDKIERCCLLKEGLIRELEELNNGKAWTSCSAQSAEIESLIKKLIDINKTNAEAVGDMKSKIISEISDLKRRKTAFKAYHACA